ncbi:MAG: hypothetical protein JNL11_16265 [Bdellovibrionaceae bacterium]|nr:hypothetical protein [Pseudobdellovibrionaceae bacterium]
MRFEILFLFIIFSLGINHGQRAQAQNYIDIDLSPPKKTPPPKQQKPTAKSTNSTPAKPPQTPRKKTAPAPTTAKKVKPKPATPPPASPAATPKPLPLPKSVLVAPQKPPPTPPPAATPVVKPPPVEPTPIPKIEPPIAKPEPPPPPPPEEKQKMQVDNFEEEAKNFRNRHAFSVDYTTWYETLKIRSRSTTAMMEGNSHYFGVAFNYDFTYYRENWGAAISVGGVTGNAQAGTKDSGDYYERRIVWTGFRGGGRLFYRANNRIELGLGFMAQSKNTKWPEEENFSIIPQANPHYFYYLDTRWRINYRYEIIQSFGTHLRSYALAWLLGVSYTLN